MKENTYKMLLWLYSDDLQQPFNSTYDQLSLAAPTLTAGGLRSMVRYLVEKQLVRTETSQQQTLISITSHGVAQLKNQFPVFWRQSTLWNRKWHCLLFLVPPKSDQGFRYLRTVLLEQKALQLSRGVYLFPGAFPDKVLSLCQELYVGSVIIFEVDQWQFGDERSTIVDSFSLLDVIETYSGISKEINRLLSVKNQQKSSYLTLKNDISSVFNRVYHAVSRDSGLTQYYFGETINPVVLLHKLRQLI